MSKENERELVAKIVRSVNAEVQFGRIEDVLPSCPCPKCNGQIHVEVKRGIPGHVCGCKK